MPNRCQILRLAHWHRGALAGLQTFETRRRADYRLGAKISGLKTFACQQAHRRQRNRVAGGRQPDQLPFEIGEAFNLGPDNQAVNWIGRLRDDGDGVGTLEHRLNQIRRGVLAGVDLALVERRDDPVRAAGNRHHFQVKPFASEEPLRSATASGSSDKVRSRRSESFGDCRPNPAAGTAYYGDLTA